MDEPATSMRSGSAAARSRSNRASDSGSVIDMAGLPVLVKGDDAAHIAAIEAVFGVTAICADAPRAEITFGPGRLLPPERAPDVRVPDLDMWHDADMLTLASEVHGVWARVSPTHAEIVGRTPPHERALRRIFHPVITHLLAHQGIFVIHAASMRKGDRGVLALGESGKGKSTMALAALLHDWRVMGDDLVALSSAADAILIRGLPKPLALPTDLDPTLADTIDGAAVITWDDRRRLHVPTDRLDLEEVELGAILVVEHGDTARSSLEPTGSDLVTSWLMGSFTSVRDAPLMRRFFPVAARAATVPRWVARHGADPETRIADAGRILAEVATTWQ
ncbi:MAG TPA: hypothetical protein VGP92_08320 [Acidimicrobiia bacterium]|nr:hypothetical protein [Acidimicrobiia bacterium]